MIDHIENSKPSYPGITFCGHRFNNSFSSIRAVICVKIVFLGFIIALFQIISQKTEVISLKSKVRRLKNEIDGLRNQSLEDDITLEDTIESDENL